MNQELARRIAVTISALLLFRLGTNIPDGVAAASTFISVSRSSSPWPRSGGVLTLIYTADAVGPEQAAKLLVTQDGAIPAAHGPRPPPIKSTAWCH